MRILILLDFDDATLDRLRALPGVERVDRSNRKAGDYRDLLAQADVVAGFMAADEFEHAPRLKWLQLGSAGANRHVERTPERVLLTDASGVHGPPCADHALAILLALLRGLRHDALAAAESRWGSRVERRELGDSTCTLLGFGDLGRQIAQRLRGFGCRILAVKRTPPKPGERRPSPSEPDEYHTLDALDAALPRTDHLILTLPGTPHTRHLLDARRLALLPRGATVTNVGRGTVIDEAALIDALKSGHLGGAALDVFETEPLPADSPLWSMPNVVITPHVAGSTPRFAPRMARLFERNLEKFLRGETLDNLVDRHWGY